MAIILHCFGKPLGYFSGCHAKANAMNLGKGKPQQEEISPESKAIDRLTEEIKNGFEWFKSHAHLVTKSDLKNTELTIMSKIAEFAAKQEAFNARVSTAIDGAVTSVTGLTEDVQTLNDKIAELQNSVGTVTPEDQVILDALEANGEALSVRVEAVAAALAALDSLTPPKPPVEG